LAETTKDRYERQRNHGHSPERIRAIAVGRDDREMLSYLDTDECRALEEICALLD